MRISLRWLCMCLCAITLTTACDESFEPLAPAMVNFSVFGYLDASADTQWIRVMPIRPSVVTRPDTLDATVTLEHLGTGDVIQLRDSIFRFTSGTAPAGSEGLYVHNFWTTERIEPGATYRLRIERSGAEPSEATIEIPQSYGVQVGLSQDPSIRDYLRLDGVKHVPFAWGRAHYTDECGASVHDSTYRVPRPEADVYTITIRPPAVPPRGECARRRVEKWVIWAVVSEAEWPTAGMLSPSGINVAPEASNVSNATGFVGGVFVSRVPYEKCELVGGRSAATYCVLDYGPTSASLKGTVIETFCGRGPVDSVTVTLRELDGEPAATRRIREAMTTPSGAFEIHALEPGIRYAVRVRAKPRIEPFVGEVETHTIHTDTVQFQPGENRQYDVALEYLLGC